MSGNHGEAPTTERINLPMSHETHEQLRWLAYHRAEPRCAVIAALVAQAAQAAGFGASTSSARLRQAQPTAAND